MSSSLLLYESLLGAVVLERGIEQWAAARNMRWSRARGGIEYGHRHYRVMVALHAMFLAGCALEPLVVSRPFIAWVGWPALGLVAACQVVRWWCVTSLGSRWNTRVIVVPGLPLVSTGPYRWVDHPNYIAVAVEGIALPLVHTAWVTALGFTAANLALLAVRVRVEDQALGRRRGGNGASSRRDLTSN